MLKPTSVALFCCFLAGYFFPQVLLIMAILNTHKTRTDNVRIVDVTNVSHQETKTKNVTLVYLRNRISCAIDAQSSKMSDVKNAE